jgi:3-oxoacyl-[acyl-carrier protein] reductase
MKKTVFISGASRGIGKAIAETFAKNGHPTIITCKDSFHTLQEIALQIEKKYSISCLPMQGDIGNEEDVNRIFSSIPPIDILINNAGIDYVGLLSDMDIKDWNRVISTNLTSAFLCSKAVIPSMIANKEGKIINISSIWGNVGASMEVAYSTSKAGLNGFTKALAKELAPSNIQVNAIACGLIDTAMNACYSTDELDAMIHSIPADRIGTPEDIAQFVLQLSTNHTYLTGQIIKIDGGWI